MHPRAQLRADLRAVIEGEARFSGFADHRALPRNVGADQCPLFYVATPRERVTPDSGDDMSRRPEIMVGLRRVGGDELEDVLDEDSAVLEPLILAVLRGVNDNDYGLDMVEVDVLADGSPRIGRLDMVFRLARYTKEGVAD